MAALITANSLVYSIQNIYFLSCACEFCRHETVQVVVDETLAIDAHSWPDDIFVACPSGTSWPYALCLCLPALSRLIQCLKRYRDSRLAIHLINVGISIKRHQRAERASRPGNTWVPSVSSACSLSGDREVSPIRCAESPVDSSQEAISTTPLLSSGLSSRPSARATHAHG